MTLGNTILTGGPMPRILRNYLISFAIIGLVLLAIHLVNRWADRQMQPQQSTPAGQTIPAK